MGKENGREIAIGFATGFVVGTNAAAVLERVRTNQEPINELKGYIDEIKDSPNLPFANETQTLSEKTLRQKGVKINSFGDSRMQTNLNAGEKGKKEIWVHKDGYPLLLKDSFQKAGFVTTAYPHAHAGDPSGEILQKLKNEARRIITSNQHQIILLTNNGNDYRSEIDNLPRLASVVFLPNFAKTDEFLEEFNKTTGSMAENILEQLRVCANINRARKELGKDEADVTVVTPDEFYSRDWVTLWSLEEDRRDKKKLSLPPWPQVIQAGNIITGGAIRATRLALEQIQKEHLGIRPLVIPCWSLNGDRDTLSDGTYHYGPKGHEAVEELILERFFVESEGGKVEPLSNRQFMQPRFSAG